MVQIYQNILVIWMAGFREVVCILLMVYMLFISIIKFTMIHGHIYDQINSVVLKTFSVNMHFSPFLFPILLAFYLNFDSCLLQHA